MTDPRESLGRLVHDVRLAENAKRERPFRLEPWEKRSDAQREMDMRIGAEVQDAVLNSAPAGGELVRQTWVYWALEQPDVAEHPNWVKSWAELEKRDREVDDRIYSAVAAKAAHDELGRTKAAEARLAEIRQTIQTFFTHHGNSNAASLTHARDLAEGIRQILDREPLP